VKTSVKTQSVFSLTLSALTLSALVACAPPNRKLEPALETVQLHSFNAKLSSETTSEVDILFVIDNSRSMAEEQLILQKNINKFVGALQAMKSDYHIGVVSVYDQGRMKPGSPSHWANGKLRPLKAGSAQLASFSLEDKENNCITTDVMAKRDDSFQPGFITRSTPNGLQTLENSLNVGILCLGHDGPHHEELFTPVLAAVRPSMNAENKGFMRENAHLAVVIVSDAIPSNRDPKIDEFVSELRAVKGNNPRLLSLHVIGVTANDVASSTKGKTCRVDYDLENQGNSAAMEQLVVGNGTFLRLCDSNWGSRLTNISTEIKRRLLNKVISVPHAFSLIEDGSLHVLINGVDTPPGPRTWARVASSNTIVFSDKLDLGATGDADIKVSYRLLTESNAKRAAAHLN
jgi:hypothetical protein